jgi:hypothetical protein
VLCTADGRPPACLLKQPGYPGYPAYLNILLT